jgi:hypothetical protein
MNNLKDGEMIKLKALKDIDGIVTRKKGDVIEYYPWDSIWQSLDEPSRVAKGLFIHCYGMGEFEVLWAGKDVEVMANE